MERMSGLRPLNTPIQTLVTVRETLNFRTELKLGSRISKKARDALVKDLIAQMRLEKAADTIVGDGKVRRI